MCEGSPMVPKSAIIEFYCIRKDSLLAIWYYSVYLNSRDKMPNLNTTPYLWHTGATYLQYCWNDSAGLGFLDFTLHYIIEASQNILAIWPYQVKNYFRLLKHVRIRVKHLVFYGSDSEKKQFEA